MSNKINPGDFILINPFFADHRKFFETLAKNFVAFANLFNQNSFI